MEINKIFEVGLSKTATTSLKKALEILDYNVLGFDLDCAKLYENDKIDDLFKIAEKYDAFKDVPWHFLDVDLLDSKFPNSKFILLDRDNQEWVKSMVSHWERAEILSQNTHDLGRYNKADTNYQRWLKNPEETERRLIANKERKYSYIKRYFKGRPNDLLVMDISTDEFNWENLCNFLGRKIPSEDFPFARTSQD